MTTLTSEDRMCPYCGLAPEERAAVEDFPCGQHTSEKCINWPCQLPFSHKGPCSSENSPKEPRLEFECVCGHAGDEHGYHSIPGNWVCGATDCDCQGFEEAEDDEWDGDENRE